ncbi:hypothetical protein Pan153_02240 [Gimesia panareensis]|uniref:Uncharacterized protein n=1 Tax=Gimesia panareensis TaxID=2527978 RepID=A0A518FGY9_9PLAN|nr:hypothetical protein Pan153_02240 [Gimesia panareensis]
MQYSAIFVPHKFPVSVNERRPILQFLKLFPAGQCAKWYVALSNWRAVDVAKGETALRISGFVVALKFSETLSLKIHWSPVDVNQEDRFRVGGCLIHRMLNILGSL